MDGLLERNAFVYFFDNYSGGFVYFGVYDGSCF